jgi:hypothetical protein
VHGSHNSYFLYNAHCSFHLTNNPELGMIQFSFEGAVLTDATDRHTIQSDLEIQLVRETCDWLTQPVNAWLMETVGKAVEIEFDRYIAAGDLEQAKRRAEAIQAKADQSGGYMGMYL